MNSRRSFVRSIFGAASVGTIFWPPSAAPARDAAAATKSGRALIISDVDDRLSSVQIDGGKIIRSIAIGHSPSAIVFDESTRMAYISNFGGASISVIDEARGVVQSAIAAGAGPAAMALDAKRRRLLICNVLDGTLGYVDLEKKITVGSVRVGEHPNSVALSGDKAFVVNSGDRTISVVDIAEDGRLTARLAPLQAAADVIVVSPTTNAAYVLDGLGGYVYSFDRSTLRLTHAVAGFGGPRAMAFDRDGLHAYVAESTSNSVAVVDLDGRAIVARIGVGMQPFAIRELRHQAGYVTADYLGGTVSVVDPLNDTAIQFGGFDRPRDLVLVD